MVPLAEIEALLHRLYLAGPEAYDTGRPPSLRREDHKKARELEGLLGELGRLRPRRLVDAAAGHAYVGLLSAALLGTAEVIVIERDPDRLARAQQAARQLGLAPPRLALRLGSVADPSVWPPAPDAVVALHACGPASDAVLEAAVRVRTRWLLLVPCCYARTVPFSAPAETLAASLGAGRHAEIRRRLVQSLIDAERTLRLEAAGYEVQVVPFVSPTVTAHNLLWRARRVGEPRRMAEAQGRLAHLRATTGG